MRKILIPIQGDFVAPRFDLATVVIIAMVKDAVLLEPPKTIIMERPSEEALCEMIIGENITDVICGGIDEVHYTFLGWKNIIVIDGVIGGWESTLEKAVSGTIRQHEIVSKNEITTLAL